MRAPRPAAADSRFAAAAVLPWEIPEAELGTQRIVQVQYAGPEGRGTLRLVLRFESPDRFHMAASDRLGRRWWELDVRDGSALVLWVRERTFCRYRGDLEIPALSLGPVPAGAVAALLMRRLPVAPRDAVARGLAAAGPTRRAEIVELDFEDRWGRRWTAAATADGPRRWTLHRVREGAGRGMRAWWRVDAAGVSRLVQPEQGLELVWRQNRPARELSAALSPLAPPRDFVPGACDAGAHGQR